MQVSVLFLPSEPSDSSPGISLDHKHLDPLHPFTGKFASFFTISRLLKHLTLVASNSDHSVDFQFSEDWALSKVHSPWSVQRAKGRENLKDTIKIRAVTF